MGSISRGSLRTTSTGLLALMATAIWMATAGKGVEATLLTVENESVTVGQMLRVHCWNNGGKDFGEENLIPFTHVAWKFTQGISGRDVMTCTFVSPGKPTTTIDVFKGYSYQKQPCNCNGIDNCFWQALNEGFWCNSNFVQKWG